MSERLYEIVEEDGEITKVPSVTTLVGCIHSYGLERYKMRLVADMARGAPLDWTQDRIISAALYEGGPAAKAGTRQHELMDFLHDNSNSGAKRVTSPEKAIMEIMDKLFADHGMIVLEQEIAVAHETEWAGRLDRVVWHPTYGVVILDLKSGKDVKPEIQAQLWGYAMATDVLVPQSSGAFLRGGGWSSRPWFERYGPPSLDVGLAAHVKLTGEAKLHPIKLAGAELALRSARGVWVWDRAFRKHAIESPLLVLDTVQEREYVAAFGPDVEVIEEMERYTTDLWAYLSICAKGLGEEGLKRLAANWPMRPDGTPVATFGQVSKGTALIPTLQEMAMLEQQIRDISTVLQLAFEMHDRPNPPRGASVEEVPPAVLALDSPHPLDIEDFKVEWEKVHKLLWPKRRAPSAPVVATRASLSMYKQKIAEYYAQHAAQAAAEEEAALIEADENVRRIVAEAVTLPRDGEPMIPTDEETPY